MNKTFKEIYSLTKSFYYAIRGLKYAIDNERNMRIHLSVIVFITEFSVLYGLKNYEYAILFLLFGLVLTAEMLNTAIEALVNLNTQSYDSLARIAKDVAAGAVFVLSLASVAVGLTFFSDWGKVGAVFQLMLQHPLLILIAAAELVVAVFFIFFWNARKSFHFRKKDRR